jgi:hypothetical protein
MGLLDDAIREHLDLKRRRGADPAEVERLEREALGPVRRNTGAAARDEADDPALTADTAYDEPDNPIAVDEAETGFADLPADAEDAEPWDLDDDATRIVAPRPEPSSPVVERAVSEQEEELLSHPPAAAADPGSGAPPPPLEFVEDDEELFADEPPAPAGTGGETTEYDVEQAMAASSEDEDDEDVLEETPEFLQDTPDHDRLWFEQRPPRDFDFDG